jgi:hypothetical protein
MRFMSGGTPDARRRFANRPSRGDVPVAMTTSYAHPSLAPAPGAPSSAEARRARAIVGPAVAGGAVALALGVYGREHDATGERITDLGFPTLLAMKSWLTTVAMVLVLFQILSALRMYGRLNVPRRMPVWVPAAHRWSGTAAFLVSLPVAYHCLWSLGLQSDRGARPLAHGLLGCAFYGAMATKLLALRARNLPGWALPIVGSLLVVTLTGIWLTSSLWFFTNVDFPALPR